MLKVLRPSWPNSLLLGRPFRIGYFAAVRAGDKARDRRNWKEAAERYERALQYDDAAFHIAIQLGHAYKEMELFEKAERQYLKAYQQRPDDDDLNLQLGHLEKLRGNFDAALNYYRRSCELNPENKNSLTEYAEIKKRSTTFMDSANANSVSTSNTDAFLPAQGNTTTTALTPTDEFRDVAAISRTVPLDIINLQSRTHFISINCVDSLNTSGRFAKRASEIERMFASG